MSTPILGSDRSWLFYVCTFVFGIVSNTSDVLCMPYLSKFHTRYLVGYFIGIGVSEMLPSLMAIAQGTSNYECVADNTTGKMMPHCSDPRFSIGVYYLITFAGQPTRNMQTLVR
ncbi:Protein Y47D7A.16 [Aphelenchoides avenae]|nr:Protein Y47D7A.16 [Aphelenchus avenae]